MKDANGETATMEQYIGRLYTGMDVFSRITLSEDMNRQTRFSLDERLNFSPLGGFESSNASYSCHHGS